MLFYRNYISFQMVMWHSNKHIDSTHHFAVMYDLLFVICMYMYCNQGIRIVFRLCSYKCVQTLWLMCEMIISSFLRPKNHMSCDFFNPENPAAVICWIINVSIKSILKPSCRQHSGVYIHRPGTFKISDQAPPPFNDLIIWQQNIQTLVSHHAFSASSTHFLDFNYSCIFTLLLTFNSASLRLLFWFWNL